MKFLWACTCFASAIAAAILLTLLDPRLSAVQQAALAAMAAGLAIVPYVFTRAMHELITPRNPPPLDARNSNSGQPVAAPKP